MHCHICGQEAIERCYSCGKLFCAEHGRINCARCQTGIVEGDPRPDRVSVRPLPPTGGSAWWRPQRAEDFEPPACHLCQGLARRTCARCLQYFCPEHAGLSGMCSPCSRSTLWGTVVMAGFFLLLAAIFVMSAVSHQRIGP